MDPPPKNPKRQEAGRRAAEARKVKQRQLLDELEVAKQKLKPEDPAPPAAVQESPITKQPPAEPKDTSNPTVMIVGAVAVGLVLFYISRNNDVPSPRHSVTTPSLPPPRATVTPPVTRDIFTM